MKYEYKKIQAPKELTVGEGMAFEPVDFKTHAISVPCQTGCPAGTNVPGYIEKIAQGRYDEAYAINLEDNVMPGVLGRICVKPCQDKCRHNWTDINGAVEICYLKRSAADRIQYDVQLPKPYFEPTGRKVAVIGGGPAGLAAARELKRYGHHVALFEKNDYLGGMLVDGIPRYRLPEQVIDVEIKQIIDSGIEVQTGKSIDQEALGKLIEEYDNIVVATGTVLSNNLKLDGIEPDEVPSGLEFMNEYNHGRIQSLKGDVVIIGGGFTAVDSARSCARTARKLMGNNGRVCVVYRRSLEFMAADKKELDEMAEENIEIKTLLSPVRVNKLKGKITSVVFQKNYLKRGGGGGKPEIVPVADAFIEIPCSHVIIAIGQKQDYSILPTGVRVTDGYRTNHPKVFAIGDFYSGSVDVIHSIADGKQVSALIDTVLTGEERIKKGILVEKSHPFGENDRRRAHDVQKPVEMPSLPLKKRAGDNPEVQKGFDDAGTQLHATRCYFCHYKLQIDQDKCIHCNWCIDVTPRKCIKKVEGFDYEADGSIKTVRESQNDEDTSFIWIDSEQCIRCGKCIRVCPVSAIEMVKTTVTPCGQKL